MLSALGRGRLERGFLTLRFFMGRRLGKPRSLLVDGGVGLKSHAPDWLGGKRELRGWIGMFMLPE